MGAFPDRTPFGTRCYVSSHNGSVVTGDLLNSGLAGGSAVHPAANLIIYVPFLLDAAMTAYQMDAYNGTVAAGNTDVGIYDFRGTRLVSIGATAQAGTSAPQVFNIADTALAPGWYYMGLSQSSATATFFRTALSNVNLFALGVRQEAGAGSLPATATFAASLTNSYLPAFGVHFTATAL